MAGGGGRHARGMLIEDLQDVLARRAELLGQGMTDRGIAAALRAGALRRVDRGGYAPGPRWAELRSEDRHLLRVLAALDRGQGADAVVSHASAAVVHGLPLFRHEPEHVHVSSPHHNGDVGERGGGAGPIARHRVAVTDADRDEVDGIPVTSLARTVADLLRTAPRACGLAAADAALRMRAWRGGERAYDADAAGVFRAAVGERLRPGARGVRQARVLLDLADGRAESPGESVSRLHLHDLGFARPRLQVPVEAPEGGWFHLDFGLDDVGVWGEFDGEVKYRDPALWGGRTLQEVLRAEKTREDWIRGTTGRRVIRWTSAEIGSARALGVLLARFHLRPGRRAA